MKRILSIIIACLWMLQAYAVNYTVSGSGQCGSASTFTVGGTTIIRGAIKLSASVNGNTVNFTVGGCVSGGSFASGTIFHLKESTSSSISTIAGQSSDAKTVTTSSNTSSYSFPYTLSHTSGTRYYVVVYASGNLFGCTEVVAITAEQPSTPPSVTTGSYISSTTTATLYGTVNPNGRNTVSWFQYGKTSYLGTETGYNGVSSSSTSNLSVSNSISGLDPNTTYYYRLAASSDAGTVYGNIETLGTKNPAVAPDVSLQPITNLTTTGAILNGKVNPRGSTTSYVFEYADNSNFLGKTTVPEKLEIIGSGTSDISVSQTISELSENNTYYYRLYASNTSGGTATSSTGSFTTLAGNALQLYAPINIPANMLKGRTYNYSIEVVNNSSNVWTGTFQFTHGSDPFGEWTKTINPVEHVTLSGTYTPVFTGSNVLTLYYKVAGTSRIVEVSGGNYSNPVTVTVANPEVYTVTFNSDGGSAVASQQVVEGNKATKPSPNPTKSGYTFAEWFNGGSQWNFNNPVTSNMTLTARWNYINHAPTVGNNPVSPTDGQSEVSTSPTFKWTVSDTDPGDSIFNYDLYLWKEGTARPTSPAASGKNSTTCNSISGLEAGKKYIWKVVVYDQHEGGNAGSRDWSFTTKAPPPTTIPVTGVSINASKTTFKVGETAGYSVTFTPTNPTNKNVTWSSSNPDVADVSDRNAQTTTVTAKKAGTATIQVVSQDGNKTSSCTVSVVQNTNFPCENPIASGVAGSLTWVLCPNGTLTIKGNGPIPDYRAYAERPWHAYRDKITAVIIENGVTSIGESTFGGGQYYPLPNLSSVTIPNTVITIGEEAFSGSGISSITIPNSVTSLGVNTFAYCYKLTSIILSNQIKSIESNTFAHCENLLSIVIPNSVNRIGRGAFEYCMKLKSIEIPNSVTSIGNDAFNICESLESISISNSVSKIESCAFCNCKKLKSVKVFWPQPLLPDRNNTFDFGASLKNVTLTVPNGTKELYEKANVWKDFGTIVEEGGSTTIPVTGVSINASKTTFKVGETAGYSVTFTPTNPTNKNVTWSSSNPDVADVSDRNAQTTTVTAKKAGTATIQVVSQDGNKSASVNITVTASTPTFTENDIIMAGPLFSSNTLTEKQKYTIAPRVGNATDHEWTGNFYLRENGTTIKTWSSTTVESHNVSHSTSLPAFEYTPTAGKKTIAFYFRTSGTSNDILVGSKTVENPIQITVNPAAVTPTLTFEDGTNYKSLTIDPERYIENIPVKSNIAWEVSMPAEATWLKVQKSGNNVYVDVASNEGNKNNGVVVTIKGTGTNANVTATLRIYQTAPYITNLPSFIPAKAAKTTETYSVESNVSWIVYWGDEGKVDWLSASPTSLTKGKKNVSFIIEENQSPEPRRKAFYIRGAGINKEILIVQGGKVETPKASITIKPKTVEFNYKGEKTTSGNVQIGFENASDVSWEATSSATWFSFPSKGTGAINNFAVTNLSENKSTTIDRTGTITINGTGQYATLEPQTLTVRQTKAPPPFIKLAQSLPNGQLNFDYTGNPHSQTFRIESNIDWTITKPDWLIVEPFNSNGQTIRDIVVNAKRNDGNKNRSGKITVKGIDRYSNYSVEVDVIQGEKIVQSKPELRVLMNGIEVQDGTEVEFNASECGENISVPLQILSNDKWEIETQYEKPDRTIQSSREFGGDGSGTYQKFDSKIFKNVSGERRGSITIRHSHSTGSESIKSISIRFTQRAEEFVYDNDTHVISRYNGTNSNVIIPYCVKIIAANAFNSAQIESINLSNVAEIGDDAFRFCDKIKTIRIPSTLTSIGDEVFKDCKSLEKFEGKSERYDADEYGVLYDIKSFPAKLLVFPPKLVRDSYTIGASDKTQNRMVIGDNAFDNNIYLAEVVINRQVYNDHTSPIAPIGKEAFKTCTNLRTVIAYWEIGEVDFIPDINGKNVFSDKTLSEGKLMIPPGTPGRKEDIKAIYKAKGWNFKNIEFLDNSNSVQVNSESSSNNSGILSFAMNIPTSETYTGSFVIYTPTGVDLSMNVSTRSSSFQNAHTYEIQQISENGYIVDIKPSSDVNIRSDTQNTYQNILSIPYNLHMPVLEYDNFVTINGLHLIGNTSVIYQDEIQVPLAYTVDNEVLPDRDELLYYPNPVDNTLTVQIPNPDGEMAAVALINLSGQIVYRTETSEAVYHVDVQSLKRGVYILQVVVGNEKYVAKVIKR